MTTDGKLLPLPDARKPRGNLGGAKLTEAQVRQIFKDERLIREIAADYGVSNASVIGIKNGRTWSHLRLHGDGYTYAPPPRHIRRSRFRSDNPDAFWNMASVGTIHECWPWKGEVKRSCHGKVRLDGRGMSASRAAWILTYGDPGDLCVLHDCHNAICVNPYHLHLGTQAQNQREKIEAGRGRAAQGEDHGHAKMTEADVLAIRADPRTHREITAQYGICTATISDIKNRKTWRHLPGEGTSDE